jgi:hypothetical protein
MLDRPADRRRVAWAKASRARRARAKACQAVAYVAYDGAVLDLLIKTKWLPEAAAGPQGGWNGDREATQGRCERMTVMYDANRHRPVACSPA